MERSDWRAPAFEFRRAGGDTAILGGSFVVLCGLFLGVLVWLFGGIELAVLRHEWRENDDFG